jgi:hypothetical protein
MQNIGRFQKFKPPGNPLEAEDKEKGMFPTASWKNEKLRKYYQKIWAQINNLDLGNRPGGRNEFWSPYFNGTPEQDLQSQSAMKTAVAFKILQLADGEIDQEIDEKFVEEFINWMLGKSKYNLDKSTTPWGTRRLVSKDINAYLHMFVDKKMEFIKELTVLRAFIPQNLPDAWKYFKYCVCKKQPNHAAFLPQFNYWTDPNFRDPNNNTYNNIRDQITGIPYSQRAIMQAPGNELGVIRDGAPGGGDPGTNAIVREDNEAIFDPASCPEVTKLPSNLPLPLEPDLNNVTQTPSGQMAAGQNTSASNVAISENFETVVDPKTTESEGFFSQVHGVMKNFFYGSELEEEEWEDELEYSEEERERQELDEEDLSGGESSVAVKKRHREEIKKLREEKSAAMMTVQTRETEIKRMEKQIDDLGKEKEKLQKRMEKGKGKEKEPEDESEIERLQRRLNEEIAENSANVKYTSKQLEKLRRQLEVEKKSKGLSNEELRKRKTDLKIKLRDNLSHIRRLNKTLNEERVILQQNQDRVDRLTREGNAERKKHMKAVTKMEQTLKEFMTLSLEQFAGYSDVIKKELAKPEARDINRMKELLAGAESYHEILGTNTHLFSQLYSAAVAFEAGAKNEEIEKYLVKIEEDRKAISEMITHFRKHIDLLENVPPDEDIVQAEFHDQYKFFFEDIAKAYAKELQESEQFGQTVYELLEKTYKETSLDLVKGIVQDAEKMFNFLKISVYDRLPPGYLYETTLNQWGKVEWPLEDASVPGLQAAALNMKAIQTLTDFTNEFSLFPEALEDELELTEKMRERYQGDAQRYAFIAKGNIQALANVLTLVDRKGAGVQRLRRMGNEITYFEEALGIVSTNLQIILEGRASMKFHPLDIGTIGFLVERQAKHYNLTEQARHGVIKMFQELNTQINKENDERREIVREIMTHQVNVETEIPEGFGAVVPEEELTDEEEETEIREELLSMTDDPERELRRLKRGQLPKPRLFAKKNVFVRGQKPLTAESNIEETYNKYAEKLLRTEEQKKATSKSVVMELFMEKYHKYDTPEYPNVQAFFQRLRHEIDNPPSSSSSSPPKESLPNMVGPPESPIEEEPWDSLEKFRDWQLNHGMTNFNSIETLWLAKYRKYGMRKTTPGRVAVWKDYMASVRGMMHNRKEEAKAEERLRRKEGKKKKRH